MRQVKPVPSSFCSTHQVVVEKLGKVSKRDTAHLPDDISDYKEAKANGEKLYIAASFTRGTLNGPREFVLGDGNTYGGYKNAPLEPETKYKAYIRGVTKFKGVRTGRMNYGRKTFSEQVIGRKTCFYEAFELFTLVNSNQGPCCYTYMQITNSVNIVTSL